MEPIVNRQTQTQPAMGSTSGTAGDPQMSHDDKHEVSRGPDVQQPEPGDSTDEAEIEVNPELHPSAIDDLPDVGTGSTDDSEGDGQAGSHRRDS